MKADERRKAIVNLLLSDSKEISGKEFSNRFSVSRQIIVQDISILKGQGYDILSTHFGYVMKSTPLKERVVKVLHTTEQTADELYTIINFGGTVVDVFVWHKIYGKIEARLNIFSSQGIDSFIEGVRTGKSVELMSVTGGYHYHTIHADTTEILDKIEKALTDKGYIVPEKNEQI